MKNSTFKHDLSLVLQMYLLHTKHNGSQKISQNQTSNYLVVFVGTQTKNPAAEIECSLRATAEPNYFKVMNSQCIWVYWCAFYIPNYSHDRGKLSLLFIHLKCQHSRVMTLALGKKKCQPHRKIKVVVVVGFDVLGETRKAREYLRKITHTNLVWKR